MSFYRRGPAGLEDFEPSLVMEGHADIVARADVPTGTSTISPYHHSLNGVSQDMNMAFVDALWWTLGGMALVVLAIRLGQIWWGQLRLVSSLALPAEKMEYWKRTQWSWSPWLKKNIIYSPFWKKRHNREFKLSAAGHMGTLPSRLHSIILFIWLTSNLIYMVFLNWSNANVYSFMAELRGRSGTLSVVNMVPLIIFAGRNNPLIGWLHISFDTYNLLHRWMGRLSVIEAVIHTFAWFYVQLADGGWKAVNARIYHKAFEASGMLGTLAMVILMILSLSPVRHAFYESFLNVHIVLALITFVCTYIHCVSSAHPGGLPQLPWMMGIFVLWFLERLARVCRTAFNNWSDKGFTEAVCEPMPGDCTRVTMHLPRYLDVKPGTHCYLRFASISPWECHPFSVAWVDHVPVHDKLGLTNPDFDPEKAPIASGAVDKKNSTTSVSFVIGAHTGFTRKLYNTAKAAGLPAVSLRAALEGPYAGHHALDSYGHCVLFAGATGITHQLSYLRPLIEGYNAGTVATRRVTLVWIVRDYEALEWVRPWMDTVLRMPGRRDILRIQLFVTRPKNPREIISASSTVQMFPGRPTVATLLRKEVEDQKGAMCVTVCGPGALADDVRQAVRQVQDENTVVDFVEESFTW
ncbi:ferric reductase like transmembrane component [Plectosphaerella plurivora]|uniref:Ferric reductase like transmembrane component n=1 Tax=Plectosphaerella plurivora TaxID=936078 RepID=A0A9P8VEP0_9PEZI|nr:ferric reductase like transmembrane component [Plectosphaerella plurivora]